jgi:cell division ATPase FtsA
LDVINNYPLPLKSIVITGGGAMLNGITDYISANTGMTVRIGNHKAVLAEESWNEFSDPVYSQLIGTIYLTSQYRKQKLVEVQEQESAIKSDKSKAKTKLPRNSIKSFFADRLINFFSDADEARMEDQKNPNQSNNDN